MGKIRTTPMDLIELCIRNHLYRSKTSLQEMSERLFITQASMTNMLKRPWHYWTLGQLVEYADASGTPVAELMTAAVKCIMNERNGGKV